MSSMEDFGVRNITVLVENTFNPWRSVPPMCQTDEEAYHGQ